MPQPSLPPRGYFVPTDLIFDPQLPDPVFRTWLQLHSLTWRGDGSISLLLQGWLDFTGISRATFFRHLAFLRQQGVLRWVTTGPGQIRIIFLPPPLTLPAGSRLPALPFPSFFPNLGSSKLGGSPSLHHSPTTDPQENPGMELGTTTSAKSSPVDHEAVGEREKVILDILRMLSQK